MNNSNDGKAIASLVLGIVSFICIWFGYSTIIGIILAIIGLVLGTNARNQGPSGMATAGIVLSVISLVLCALVLVACVMCAGLAGAAISSIL